MIKMPIVNIVTSLAVAKYAGSFWYSVSHTPEHYSNIVVDVEW